ncbi:MAG: NAD-dependent epimerase/dehydratase family protein [Solirubrobacterales bacterium]
MPGVAFVTGASSFAGRELCRQLVDAGWRVHGTVNRRNADVEGVVAERVDIADRDRLVELIDGARPDVVFHLAAIVDTVETPSTIELYRVNTLGTAAVTDAISTAAPSARLVFTSSAFVYGRTSEDEQPISESLALRPVTPYGASKVAAEAIVGQFARAGGDGVVSRAFQHSGRGHVGAYALSDWARQVAEIAAGLSDPRVSVGNLEVERDYLDVRDVASAYIALAEKGTSGEVYNVASGRPVTMRALLDGLIEQFAIDVAVEPDPARMRKVDQQTFVARIEKLESETGWNAEFSTEEMLASLANYWRAETESRTG